MEKQRNLSELHVKVLARSALKPSKLKRHLETNYLKFENQDADFFECQTKNEVKSRFDNTVNQWKENAAGLKASDEVTRKISVARKPHNIGEQLILFCCQIIISSVLENFEL